MKVTHLELSLSELQKALRDYAKKNGCDPEHISVVSHNKSIRVEMAPEGVIECDKFRHRAEA